MFVGFLLGLLVCRSKNRTVEVSYPNGRRGAPSVRYAVPVATLGSEHRHQQEIKNSGFGNEKREMAKRHNGHEIRTARATGTGISVVQRHTDREFREVRRSARGGDPWARRTRGCAAAVKGEIVVEVSEGQGQVARACEDRL